LSDAQSRGHQSLAAFGDAVQPIINTPVTESACRCTFEAVFFVVE
jgi:hypothetical protein